MRHFLQSADWAKFHESLGTQVLRHETKNGQFFAYIEKSQGKIGKLFTRMYIPYGPFADTKKDLTKILSDVEDFAKSQKVDYIRVEPTLCAEESLMTSLGYIRRARPSQPEQTSIVDLRNKSTDEVIASMNATNRNLWRTNASKPDGLTFDFSYDPSDTEALIDMMQTTADRLGLVFHDAHYTKQMVSELGPSKSCGVMYAIHDKKKIAGAQFAVDHDAKVLYYLHAGSYSEARSYNAGNLLLSSLILYAHQLQLEFVDLFGVSPKDAPKDHPQAGFSGFKRSFGGDDVQYFGTWEKGITSKYKILQLGRKKNTKGR